MFSETMIEVDDPHNSNQQNVNRQDGFAWIPTRDPYHPLSRRASHEPSDDDSHGDVGDHSDHDLQGEVADDGASDAQSAPAELAANEQLEILDGVDPARLPLARVEAEICTLAGQIAAATSRFLKLLADFDSREGWAGWNIRSCAQWLSWRCGLDLRTAREHVRVARALTELPKIQASFDAGRISYSKVRAIARVATPTSEEDLLEAALHAPASHVERLTRGLRKAQRNSSEPDEVVSSHFPSRRRSIASAGTGTTREIWSSPAG